MPNPNEVKFRLSFNRIDSEKTEIQINDYIAQKQSYDFWSDEKGTEVTPDDFVKQIEDSNSKFFDVIFNSGGGEVFAAQQIATAIKKKRKSGCKFTAKIESICASAAVQIAMACDEVQITKGGYIMIHDPMIFHFGYINIADANDISEELSAIKNGIVSEYAEKTKLSKREIVDLMAKTTWLYGEDAVNKGFADSIMLAEEEPSVVENKIVNVLNNMNGSVAASLNLPKTLESVLNKKSLNNKEEKEMEIKTVDELKKQYPELTDELVNTAIENHIAENPVNQVNVEDAVKAERERIKAIDEMAGKVNNDLLAKAKYETLATAENVAMEAIKSGAFVQAQVLDAMKAETATANKVAGVEPPAGTGAVDEKKLETEKASNVAENYFKSIGKVE